MKVYVAGSSSDLPRVRSFMQSLKDNGHVITMDWTAYVQRASEKGYTSDDQLSDEAAKRFARADLDGIYDANVFVLLRNPQKTSFGSAYEAGVAYAHVGLYPLRKIVVGSHMPIFLRGWEHYDTDEEALAKIGQADHWCAKVTEAWNEAQIKYKDLIEEHWRKVEELLVPIKDKSDGT